jgi:hypothetical protein
MKAQSRKLAATQNLRSADAAAKRAAGLVELDAKRVNRQSSGHQLR